jgi:transposase
MEPCQALSCCTEELGLRTERLGPLPLINHFLKRLRLDALLERFVPTTDRRVRLPFATGIGVLLRSILVEREPIYRQHETVGTFAPTAFGLTPELVEYVGDDALGRALDQLFDADRGTLLTEVVVAAGQQFGLSFAELHNDSTSISFCGQYAAARGRSLRGKRAPFITFGYSKAHRPDLKQLLFILTTTADGGVPVQFRCEAGNYPDANSHQATWDALCQVAGRKDFLFVADSKLCCADAMDHIAAAHGRFVCVMPRSRQEDAEFRAWIQDHDPAWVRVIDRPHPRRRRGPRDRWWVFRYPLPSREGWPVVWVRSALLALHQEHRRRERLARAVAQLEALQAKLTGPQRRRRRSRQKLEQRLATILRRCKVERYLKAQLKCEDEPVFRQAAPGRPGPHTRYVRKTRATWRLEWQLDESRLAYDHKSDGMYPLLTNDRQLTDAQILQAHKRQPTIEKRFHETKSVFDIAPVCLKNEGRIEALFFVYFLVLLVQALIERELRLAMKQAGLRHLPLYPEERQSARPTADHIFRLFSLTQRHLLQHQGTDVHWFAPDLTPLQRQVLKLLRVPEATYHGRS